MHKRGACAPNCVESETRCQVHIERLFQLKGGLHTKTFLTAPTSGFTGTWANDFLQDCRRLCSPIRRMNSERENGATHQPVKGISKFDLTPDHGDERRGSLGDFCNQPLGQHYFRAMPRMRCHRQTLLAEDAKAMELQALLSSFQRDIGHSIFKPATLV